MFKKLTSIDNLWYGLGVGLTMPALAFGLSYILKELLEKYLQPGFVNILCIGIDFLLFMYFIKAKKDNTARGVLLATFVYAFLFFYWYFNMRTSL